MRGFLRALIALAVLLPAAAGAQTWPAKPIRVFIGYAPGAAPDIVCRLVMTYLSRDLGQQVVVENRPGAGAIIGAQAAAHAAPDGYNFLYSTSAAVTTNLFAYKKLPYDPDRDFAPVAIIGTNPFFVLANPSVPANTLPELLALDKAKPGTLSFASDGPRNFSGLLGEWINHLAGTHILHVPYNVMPQGVQDTVAGRVQVVMLAVAAARPYIEAKQLRPLAISSAERVPGFESVPPVADTFPGFDFVGTFYFFAPAGTAPEIVTRMNQALDKVLKEKEVQDRLLKIGVTTHGASTPDDVRAYLKDQRERWGKVFHELAIPPE